MYNRSATLDNIGTNDHYIRPLATDALDRDRSHHTYLPALRHP